MLLCMFRIILLTEKILVKATQTVQIGYRHRQQNAGHHVHQRYFGLGFPSKKRMRNSAKRSQKENLFQIIVANRHPNIYFLAKKK